MLQRFALHTFPGSIVVVLLGAIAILAAAPARATTLFRYEELPTLVEESRRALLAEVVEVRHGYDASRLHSTWLTLRVEEPLYGVLPAPGGELTIKIYGAPDEMPDGTRLFIEGTPLFEEGRRYLLLLRHDSPWGFTGVAGLFQGAFAVERDASAGLHVRIPGPRRTLFGDTGSERWLEDLVSEQQQRSLTDGRDDAVPYPLLRQVVQQLWRARGGAPWHEAGAAGDDR